LTDVRIECGENGREVFVFDPYNPLNEEITTADLERILREYGLNIPVHNEVFYKRAFIHRSYVRRPTLENEANNVRIAPQPANCLPLRQKSNETLEFLGDGVLDCIAKYYLYRRFPKQNEGFMTEKKIALVKNESIGKIAYEMGLHRWFILSRHAEMKQTRTNLKKLGCLFEAFIGAIFLDFNHIQVNDEGNWFQHVFLSGPGFQAAQIFIETVFEKHVDWASLIVNDDNYKNILQVKIQKEFKVTPVYLEMDPTADQQHISSSSSSSSTAPAAAGALPSPPPSGIFHMGVFLNLGYQSHELRPENAIPFETLKTFARIHESVASPIHGGRIFVFLGEGKHKIKKKAEQIACEAAIKKIRSFSSATTKI
jgi:dsRNA-specific ribonuclease